MGVLILSHVQHVRMHPLRVLLNVVSELLVEPGRVPRPRDAHGGVPLDGGLPGT